MVVAIPLIAVTVTPLMIALVAVPVVPVVSTVPMISAVSVMTAVMAVVPVMVGVDAENGYSGRLRRQGCREAENRERERESGDQASPGRLKQG